MNIYTFSAAMNVDSVGLSGTLDLKAHGVSHRAVASTAALRARPIFLPQTRADYRGQKNSPQSYTESHGFSNHEEHEGHKVERW